MSSSLLLKIRVALQSGDRESAINLRQNEQSNNQSSEMKSTYINTRRHSAVNINTGLWGNEAGTIYPHIHVKGEVKVSQRVSTQLVMVSKRVLSC